MTTRYSSAFPVSFSPLIHQATPAQELVYPSDKFLVPPPKDIVLTENIRALNAKLDPRYTQTIKGFLSDAYSAIEKLREYDNSIFLESLKQDFRKYFNPKQGTEKFNSFVQNLRTFCESSDYKTLLEELATQKQFARVQPRESITDTKFAIMKNPSLQIVIKQILDLAIEISESKEGRVAK